MQILPSFIIQQCLLFLFLDSTWTIFVNNWNDESYRLLNFFGRDCVFSWWIYARILGFPNEIWNATDNSKVTVVGVSIPLRMWSRAIHSSEYYNWFFFIFWCVGCVNQLQFVELSSYFLLWYLTMRKYFKIWISFILQWKTGGIFIALQFSNGYCRTK